MGKTWVLDTETKGTGAEMVPLEKTRKASGSRGPVVVGRKPEPAPDAPRSKRPPRFKVVDVMTERVLAEGASTRETLGLLAKMRSLVDVRIFVWDDAAGQWRRLSLGEHKSLWQMRGR
jgi:hypothetical protein